MPYKNKAKAKECKRRFQLGNSQRCKDAHSRWVDRNPHLVWARSTLKSHAYRGNAVVITVKELVKLANETTECEFCGTPLKFIYGIGHRQDGPTLDRLQNSKTLTKENIAIICKRCNTSKGDRTMDEFINYCRKIYERFGN